MGLDPTRLKDTTLSSFVPLQVPGGASHSALQGQLQQHGRGIATQPRGGSAERDAGAVFGEQHTSQSHR